MFGFIVQAQPIDKSDPATLSELENVFARILGFSIPMAGIVLFVMLILGGIKFITAGSDPGKAESAKKTITWAVAGVVFLALAYLVLRIIATITGNTDILIFRISLD